jgi:guanosine-3',5'-bis(diphosphate) 3'-pyrophosphohydrolase
MSIFENIASQTDAGFPIKADESSTQFDATPDSAAPDSAAASEAATDDWHPVQLFAGEVEIKSDTPDEVARAQVRALIERTRRSRPTSDAGLLERAYAFAHEKHEGQKRRTGEPYIEHPIAVAGILAELGMDDPTLAAGLLHDVVEDCGVTFEEMAQRFGMEVAQLVDGVTKLKRIDFSSKQEKQAENLRKLFLAMAGDVRVIIIKLADRLHNMRTLSPFPEQRRREIASETLQILAPIAHRLGIWRIKWELEDLSFKYLEPDIYRQIYALVQRTRDERSSMVQNAIEALGERLRAEGIPAEISGRPKHFYSIYQKMLKQGLKFDQLHDLIALRVICPTEGDCYHALGVVHNLWLPVPEMFADYIAKPKPNNYQSLHTKVLGPTGDSIEVQIRTREMHRDAEFGIAAHWRYKEDGDSEGKTPAAKMSGAKPSNGANDSFGSKLRWLRLVLELQSDTQDDAESFLDSLKLDLYNDQIFAFTPRADVIYLPQDSTPVDFAYRVHSDIGGSCVGAKVNGRIVPLDYKLHNGDICEIVTSKRLGTGPKRGWLDFVVTPHAKNRIKASLRKQNVEENIREGLDRLEKAAQSERLKLGKIADNESLLQVARTLNFKNVNDLLAAIGYGEHSADSILKRVRELTGAANDTLSGAANALLTRNIVKAKPKNNETELPPGSLQIGESEDENGANGRRNRVLDDVLFTLAKCCAPIPGDAVRGYVTRGRGVTVHREDCPNLAHYEAREPGRIIVAQWHGEGQKAYRALVAIESRDRVGLLHDVTSVISESRINIHAVNTYPLKDSRARLNIAITISDVDQMNALMVKLRGIEGVTEVHRV